LTRMGSAAVPGLIEIIKDKKVSALGRCRAINVIGRIGRRAQEALPTIEAGLNDKSPLVAIESAVAYMNLGGDQNRALSIFREGFKSKDSSTIQHTLDATMWLGAASKELVPEMVPLLEHEKMGIRIGAAKRLAKMGPAAKPAVKVGWCVIRLSPRFARHQLTLCVLAWTIAAAWTAQPASQIF
jgi:HEAT repeat protein